MRTRYYAAAGGLVVRNGQLLILHKHRQDEYVLPKGHIEAGETTVAAALRETREETGYVNLEVLTDLGTLRSAFELKGIHVLRDETYFLMRLRDLTRIGAADHDDAAHDEATFREVWAPIIESAERLSFEPARTFARRAAAWLAAHGQSGWEDPAQIKAGKLRL